MTVAEHARRHPEVWQRFSPRQTLVRYPESDQSVAARYARSIAYHKEHLDEQAYATIDGLIAEIGPGLDLSRAEEVIDGTDLILAPSLVNGHTHAAMAILRGQTSTAWAVEYWHWVCAVSPR